MNVTSLPPGVGPFLLDVSRVRERPTALENLIDKEGIFPRGVLHVGGHYGQEIELYMACGFDPIILVEANAAVFERLCRHVNFWADWLQMLKRRYGFERLPRIIPVHAAASDKCGHAAFYVTEHDPQSSILPPLDPRIRARGTVEVVCATADQILMDHGIPFEEVGMLSMDAQGAEAMVLAGASRLLPHLDLVLTEVNYEPRYRRGASVEEIDSMITKAGFEEVLRTEPLPEYPVGDILYRRR